MTFKTLAYEIGYKDGSIAGYNLAKSDISGLVYAAKVTLTENLHLCDGDDCTLRLLRDSFNDLPDSIKKLADR